VGPPRSRQILFGNREAPARRCPQNKGPAGPAKKLYKVKIVIRVCIVEDDASARAILVGWLNSSELFRCVGDYGDCETALKLLPAQSPEVILMDINLPGMSGIECVGRLKPLLPKTQFVMLTVYEDADHIFNALEAGATGYLLKQTPRRELFAAISNVYEGGSPMTSNNRAESGSIVPAKGEVAAERHGSGRSFSARTRSLDPPLSWIPLQRNRGPVEHQRYHGEHLHS